MAPHLAPITRSQLMDLEALLKRAHPMAEMHAAESPTVRPATRQGSGGVSPGGSWVGRQASTPPVMVPTRASVSRYHDIFRDHVCKRWSSSERGLYLVWWGFRPSHCKDCGMVDSWTPSPEDEYRCGHCGTGAGSTAQPGNVEEQGMMGDDDEDSDGDHGDGDGDADTSSSAAGLYQFFLSWMMSLPKALLETNLPKGQAVALVLRTSYELSLILTLPSMAPSNVFLVRGASFFLGLAANGFNVPFPLYVRGGQSTAVQHQRVVAASSEQTLMHSGGLLAVASRSEEIQWLDVEAAARQVGLDVPQFFESMTASKQYMQNTMRILADDFHVPSILWRFDRVEGREEVIGGLKAQSTGQLSPEHRAAVVALELCRRYDASHNPLCASSDDVDDIKKVREWYGKYTSDERLHPSRSNGADAVVPPPYLPTTKLADLLLRMFAFCFRVPELVVCEMAMVSGCYDGPTNFHVLLQTNAANGQYIAMPLFRRLSPFISPWYVVYQALHSEDRLPMLAALSHVATATERHKEVAAAKVVQRICRKHGASTSYTFYYAIRCVDPEEKHMHGLYACTYVSHKCAVFTCIRSGRKTITYHAQSRTVSLCYMGSKERVLEADGLAVVWVGPLTASVESHTAKYVMDCSRSGLHLAEWSQSLQKLTVCAALRKASRTSPFPTHCLTSIRELLHEASMNTDTDTQLSGSAGTQAFSEVVLARLAMREVMSVIHPSLLRGECDDKVLLWYHLLLALAEVRSPLMLGVGEDQHAVGARSMPPTTDAQFQARVFGGPGRLRHRMEDVEGCLEDIIRCVKAVKSGVRADVSEEVRKRSMRRRRREEELKHATWGKE